MDYYAQLEKQQRNGIDITHWLGWFLACLGRALSSAETTLAAVIYKSALWQKASEKQINDRARRILNRLLDGFEGPMTTSNTRRLPSAPQILLCETFATWCKKGCLFKALQADEALATICQTSIALEASALAFYQSVLGQHQRD
ncbi:MAG: hypothetical protein AAF810_18480 [Cyanobacteria bacterium P01_D01_bin.36]